MAVSTGKRVRTTVRVPKPLYEQARKFVDTDLVGAENINDFFVVAISAYVELLRRKEIDAQFARMATDADYHKESKLITEQFSQSDWEAFKIAEKRFLENK
jgi:hypothetical protein